MSDTQIRAAHTAASAFVRVTGRATFVDSQDLRTYANSRLAAGTRTLVVDLSACTFMVLFLPQVI